MSRITIATRPSQAYRSVAVSAQAMNFDRGGSDLEAAAPGVLDQGVLDFRIVEFIDLAAGFADLERRDAGMDLSMPGMTTDEGVHAFQAVHPSVLQELVERAIDLQRSLQAVAAQAIEDAVGAERLPGRFQHPENETLVPRQLQIMRMGHLCHCHLHARRG